MSGESGDRCDDDDGDDGDGDGDAAGGGGGSSGTPNTTEDDDDAAVDKVGVAEEEEKEEEKKEEECQQQEDELGVIMDELWLRPSGNHATVSLLMRGMPIPATFGFPGTDGSWCSNGAEFVNNFHPVVSIWLAHPLHPFTRKERLVVYVCSVAFNFLFTAVASGLELPGSGGQVGGGLEKDLCPEGANIKHCLWYRLLVFYIVKHGISILYAVLIRQLVICPCYYSGVLAKSSGGGEDLSSEEREDLLLRARRLKSVKEGGERALLYLGVFHVCCIILAIVWTAGVQKSPLSFFFIQIILSELFNFFFWYIKFSPVFLLLYPRDRATWFRGSGSLARYATCREGCGYKHYPNYLDPDFPRCVVPDATFGEDKKIRCSALGTLIAEIWSDGSLSAWQSLENH